MKKSQTPKSDPRATIQRLMQSTGYEEEESSPTQLSYSTRDEDDIGEGSPSPEAVRFARTKAKEIEAAVPGAKTRVEAVDEWISIGVTLPTKGTRALKLKVGDTVTATRGIWGTVTGTVKRIDDEGTRGLFAEVRDASGLAVRYPVGDLQKQKRSGAGARLAAPAQPPPPPPTSPKLRRDLQPGDEVKYTLFTIGGSRESTAIVTWDHGKNVAGRTISGERINLERAADGTLRRFT